MHPPEAPLIARLREDLHPVAGHSVDRLARPVLLVALRDTPVLRPSGIKAVQRILGLLLAKAIAAAPPSEAVDVFATLADAIDVGLVATDPADVAPLIKGVTVRSILRTDIIPDLARVLTLSALARAEGLVFAAHAGRELLLTRRQADVSDHTKLARDQWDHCCYEKQ